MGPIVLFDGVCNFCNGAVNFIISIDKRKIFRFASLQSETGQQLRAKYDIGPDVDSVILIDNDRAYTHSAAGLRIYKLLGGAWSLLYALIVIPRPLRDYFYKVFARNRYKLFGRRDACMIPTPDVRERFI